MIRNLQDSESIPKEAFCKKYVIDIKDIGDGVNSFSYLAAYTLRGFIGNERITQYDGKNVTFKYTDSETKLDKFRTLPALEFLELYWQHILPKGGSENTTYRNLGSSSTKKTERGQRNTRALLSGLQ